jgi:hypothetical protein
MTHQEVMAAKLAVMQAYLPGHTETLTAVHRPPPMQHVQPVGPTSAARPTAASKPYAKMSRAELEEARPWLRPAKPSTKLVDPYVR